MTPANLLATLKSYSLPGVVSGASGSDGSVARAPGSMKLSTTQRNAQLVTLSPAGTVPGFGDDTLSTKQIIIIVVATVGGVLLLAIVIVILCRRKRRQARTQPASSRTMGSPTSPRRGPHGAHLQPRLEGVTSEPGSPFPRPPMVIHRPHSMDPMTYHQAPPSRPSPPLAAKRKLAPINTTNLRTTSDKSPIPEPGTPMAHWLDGLQPEQQIPRRPSTPYVRQR